MFEEWRKRRILQKEISFLEKKKIKLGELNNNDDELWELNTQIDKCQQKLNTIDTNRLVNKVNQLGIEIPSDKENWWWDDLNYVGVDHFRSYLTDVGKAGISKLIREERRKNIQWWVNIIITIFTALTGLIGSIIGVISVLRN